MPGFSVTPVGPFPPVNAEDFPNYMQWQWEGTDLGGADVDTVNVTGAVEASRGTGEQSGALTLDFGSVSLSWRDVPGDTTLAISDDGNGLSTSGTTGVQNVIIPADTGDEAIDLPNGASVLVYAEGAAGVDISAASGVQLNIRSGFVATLAGQYAVVTLLKRRANEWVLCGDMGAA